MSVCNQHNDGNDCVKVSIRLFVATCKSDWSETLRDEDGLLERSYTEVYTLRTRSNLLKDTNQLGLILLQQIRVKI